MEYVGLQITTYEIGEDGKRTPTLSHIFWGKDLDRAIQVAKSHLITDAFFSSSFLGEMPWKDSILHLSNEGDILSQETYDNKRDLQDALDDLEDRAYQVRDLQKKMNLFQVIERISRNL